MCFLYFLKMSFPSVIFIMTKAAAIHCIFIFICLSRPCFMESCHPWRCVLLSQCTDETVEIQRGQALCQRTCGSGALESRLEHRSFRTQSSCFVLPFHESTLCAVWAWRSDLIAWDLSSFICDMGVQNYMFSKKPFQSENTRSSTFCSCGAGWNGK